MLNVLDWNLLDIAINYPVQGTTSVNLLFDRFYFEVHFDPLTIHVSWEHGFDMTQLTKVSFVEKVDELLYFSVSGNFPIPERFTLAELFMALWEIQKVYESEEYKFLKEVM